MAVELPTDLNELKALIDLATASYFARQEEERQETQNARVSIANSITSLQGILGPEDSEPGTTSIRAIRAYGDEAIQTNAAVAVPLILQGLEALTATMIAIAQVTASQVD